LPVGFRNRWILSEADIQHKANKAKPHLWAKGEEKAMKIKGKILKLADLNKTPQPKTVISGFRGGSRKKLRDLSFMDDCELYSKSGRFSDEAKAINKWLKTNHPNHENMAQPVGSRVDIDRMVSIGVDILKNGLKNALTVCEIAGEIGLHVPAGRHRCLFFAVMFGLDFEIPVVCRVEKSIAEAKRSAKMLDDARRKEFLEDNASDVFCWVSDNGPSSGPDWVIRTRRALNDGKINGHGLEPGNRMKATITARVSAWDKSGLAAVADEIGMPKPQLSFEVQPDGTKGLTTQGVVTAIYNGSNLRYVSAEDQWDCCMRLYTNMEWFLSAYKRMADDYLLMAELVLKNIDTVPEEIREQVKGGIETFISKSHCVFQHHMLKDVSIIAGRYLYGEKNEMARTPDALKRQDIEGVARICLKAVIENIVDDAASGIMKGKVLRVMLLRKVLSRKHDMTLRMITAEVGNLKNKMTPAEIKAADAYTQKAPTVSWETFAKSIMKGGRKQKKLKKVA